MRRLHSVDRAAAMFVRCVVGSRSKHESPSPPTTVLQRKIDFKEKISDTSLFAELVKDKHKRAKVRFDTFLFLQF